MLILCCTDARCMLINYVKEIPLFLLLQNIIIVKIILFLFILLFHKCTLTKAGCHLEVKFRTWITFG